MAAAGSIVSLPQWCNDQKGHWADPPVNCVLSILYFLLCVLFFVLHFNQQYATWLALMRYMDKHRLVGPIHWRWSMVDWGAISGVVEAPVVDDHYCHLWQDCTPPSPLCKSTNSAQESCGQLWPTHIKAYVRWHSAKPLSTNQQNLGGWGGGHWQGVRQRGGRGSGHFLINQPTKPSWTRRWTSRTACTSCSD